MKNYTYGWLLKERGYVEIPEDSYSESQKEMQEYVSVLSDAIAKAHCGWSGVKYAVMQLPNDDIEEFMVLWVQGGGSRWIPISMNSKGENFRVLGENIW